MLALLDLRIWKAALGTTSGPVHFLLAFLLLLSDLFAGVGGAASLW